VILSPFRTDSNVFGILKKTSRNIIILNRFSKGGRDCNPVNRKFALRDDRQWQPC
jgi:hypothetical protein